MEKVHLVNWNTDNSCTGKVLCTWFVIFCLNLEVFCLVHRTMRHWRWLNSPNCLVYSMHACRKYKAKFDILRVYREPHTYVALVQETRHLTSKPYTLKWMGRHYIQWGCLKPITQWFSFNPGTYILACKGIVGKKCAKFTMIELEAVNSSWFSVYAKYWGTEGVLKNQTKLVNWQKMYSVPS
jgi:hypothetical protein